MMNKQKMKRLIILDLLKKNLLENFIKPCKTNSKYSNF